MPFHKNLTRVFKFVPLAILVVIVSYYIVVSILISVNVCNIWISIEVLINKESPIFHFHHHQLIQLLLVHLHYHQQMPSYYSIFVFIYPPSIVNSIFIFIMRFCIRKVFLIPSVKEFFSLIFFIKFA